MQTETVKQKVCGSEGEKERKINKGRERMRKARKA